MWKIRVVLLGDTDTGKSTLMQCCTRGALVSPVYPTIGVDYDSTTVEVDGDTMWMQVWDTAGQERFRSLVDGYYRGAAAILLCVAANNVRSLHSAQDYWYPQIRLHNPNAHVFLVLTKSDVAMPTVERAAHAWAAQQDLVLLRSERGHCTHVLQNVAAVCYSAPPPSGVVVSGSATTSPLLDGDAASAAGVSASCCCGARSWWRR